MEEGLKMPTAIALDSPRGEGDTIVDQYDADWSGQFGNVSHAQRGLAITVGNSQASAPGDVADGDEVYIRTVQGYYFCENPLNTHCAAASADVKCRARFVVEYTICQDEEHAMACGTTGIRLKLADSEHPYLDSCRYLYAATTGSTKYDEARERNSKQFWRLRDGSVQLPYGQPVQLLDMYVNSYMCVNVDAPVEDHYLSYLTESMTYPGGESKVWVEAKYERHLLPSFQHQFSFERANPNRPNAPAG